MAFWDKLIKGGAEGLIGGVGELCKDVRTAITGKEPMTAEQVIKLDEQLKAMEAMVLNADKEVIQGQLEINKLDAQSGSLFRGGWRPFVGWLSALALGYQFLLRPLLPWIFTTCNIEVTPLPSLEMNELMTILGGLLGLGGFRTYEKVKGLK